MRSARRRGLAAGRLESCFTAAAVQQSEIRSFKKVVASGVVFVDFARGGAAEGRPEEVTGVWGSRVGGGRGTVWEAVAPY